jgi:hypothetical protein
MEDEISLHAKGEASLDLYEDTSRRKDHRCLGSTNDMISTRRRSLMPRPPVVLVKVHDRAKVPGREGDRAQAHPKPITPVPRCRSHLAALASRSLWATLANLYE